MRRQVFDVEKDDYFIVLCCDGIFDVLSDEEVVQVNCAPSRYSPLIALTLSEKHQALCIVQYDSHDTLVMDLTNVIR